MVKSLSAAHQKIYEAYTEAAPKLTDRQLVELRSRIRSGRVSAKDFGGKLRIDDEIFREEYKNFQKLKKNLGTDAEFAEHLNKNYKPKMGEVFTTDGIQIKRRGLNIKSPIVSGTPPSLAKTFKEVTEYVTKLVNKANTGEKFVMIDNAGAYYAAEDIKSKVMDKFKFKSYTNLKSDVYPILNQLHKRPEKIDLVLRNMLKEDAPLKQNWVDEVAKRTGITSEGVGDNLNKSKEYNKIKDKGADYIKRIGGKKLPRDFYTMSFSEQLPYALEIASGSPRYTGMGGETKYGARPQNKIMQFALRSWNQTKGSADGPIQFFKKGSNTPITWKHGLTLPFSGVSFSYDGKKHTFQDLRSPNYMKNYFSELYAKQNALNRLGTKLVDNPFKKGTMTVRELITEIQKRGYEWKPSKGSLDVLHGKKGVAYRPFTDLTYSSKDINQLEAGIERAFKAKKISQSQANEALKIVRSDIKGLTGPKLDTAIIDRQMNLAKRIKAGTLKGYETMSNAVRTLYKTSEGADRTRIQIILGCRPAAASGGRVGFAAGTLDVCVNTKLTQQPLESSQKIMAGIEEGATGVLGKMRNTARGFLGALGKWGPKVGKYGAVVAAGALAQPLLKPLVRQFLNDDPTTYLTDPDQQEGMLLAILEAQERPRPRNEILDWSHTGAAVGATAAALPGTVDLYKYRRGLLESKIPKAGPITEAGLTAGDYLKRHGKGFGKIRAGAGAGMKFFSGMFTPAGLLATEPLRIAQMRSEGESWGEVAKSPSLWMGPAFAPGMTSIATSGMKKGSMLAKALRLGMSPAALKLLGRAGGYGLLASLGLTGYDKYQDWKNKRGWFAKD